jgi:hypothetical protein
MIEQVDNEQVQVTSVSPQYSQLIELPMDKITQAVY